VPVRGGGGLEWGCLKDEENLPLLEGPLSVIILRRSRSEGGKKIALKKKSRTAFPKKTFLLKKQNGFDRGTKG